MKRFALFLTILLLTFGACSEKKVVKTGVPEEEQPPEELPKVQATVHYLGEGMTPPGIPTALYPFLTELGGSLISVDIQNKSDGPVDVTVASEIQGITETAADTIHIVTGQIRSLRQMPALKSGILTGLTTQRVANLHWKVSYSTDGEETILSEETISVDLWAKDVIAWTIQVGEQTLDVTAGIAAWVTPLAPEVNELVSKAARRMKTLLEKNMEIKAGAYIYYAIPLTEGDGIHADVQVTGGALNVWLFDQENFDAFGQRDGSHARVEPYREDTEQFDFDFTPSEDGTYYLVLDNTANVLQSRQAALLIEKLNADMVGYQGEGLSDSERKALVLDQVEAIYNALKEDYALSFDATPIHYPSGSQRVRLPAEALQSGILTSLDAVVLFASALENVGLDPYVALVPDHAFLCCATREDGTSVQPLEATAIADDSFEEACATGMALWDEYSEEKEFKLIAIKQARARGLTPMSKRIP